MGYDCATRNRLRTIAKTMSLAPPKDDAAAIKKAVKSDDGKKKKKRRKTDDELEDKTMEKVKDEEGELDEPEPKPAK